MPTAPNKTAIANAIKALLDGTGAYADTFIKQPRTFNGQSPCAVIWLARLRPDRFSMGGGVRKDISLWRISTCIEETEQTTSAVGLQMLAIVDTLTPLFHQHVNLNLGVSTILSAQLDGQVSPTYPRSIEGTLYSCFDLMLRVDEEYSTPIGL